MRILGVDYGQKRFGFAISDPSGEMALALQTVEVSGEDDALRRIKHFVDETEAESVVVGLPLNMNGSVGPMAEKVLAFVARLQATLKIPVETYDERLSTSSVERILLDADVSRQKRKGLRDKLAARSFLQDYLDSRILAARGNGSSVIDDRLSVEEGER